MWIFVTTVVLITATVNAQRDCDLEDVDVVGWNSVSRPTTDGEGWTFVFSGVEVEIPCDGVVIQWSYFAAVAQPFRAIVWRRTSVDTQYSVVGINDIPAGPINEAVVHTVPKEQRIQVRQGDLIGLAMNEVNARVPYRNGGTGAATVRWYRDQNPNDLQPGETATTTGVTPRTFSFSAVVLVLSTHEATFLTDEDGKTIYQVRSEGKATLEMTAEFPNEG